MKKNLKITIALILCAVIIPIATSCANSGKTTLYIYNWGDYINPEVIERFEKEHDIKVVYDTFATNEDMYVKLKSGGSSYDVLFPSDYMIERLINEDLLYKIDFNNVPNYKYIEDRFKNLSYDPNNEYSVPYMWGTLGIIYNKNMVDDPVDSWTILWNEKYKNNILMLDSQRDSIGITLKMLGYSLNTTNEDELEKAKNALIEQKPLVLSYVGDDVKDKMISEEAALAVVWSGDAVLMKTENPNLEYVVPKEGGNLWFDAMVIPKTSKNKEAAELFINFMCEPEIAFLNADYIKYSSPHSEVKNMLDEELANDEDAYPPDEVIENCEVFKDLGEDLKLYDRIWTEIKAK